MYYIYMYMCVYMFIVCTFCLQLLYVFASLEYMYILFSKCISFYVYIKCQSHMFPYTHVKVYKIYIMYII